MRTLVARAERAARVDASVLLTGESGVGKEVMARHIHLASARARAPFVAINCAAIPDSLLEATLFGHEKGSFTGASRQQAGKFEQAQGGTLFLDEIGELPTETQVKLLRVLQERSLVRLGGERAIALDVRVVAATNKNLREQITQRQFREDLYFRLSTFKLRVPALAERSGDILPLAARLLSRHMRSKQAWSLSEDAQRALLSYSWPFNVRELENIIQRAMVLCADTHIDTQHLMFDDASTCFLLAMAPAASPEAASFAAQTPAITPSQP